MADNLLPPGAAPDFWTNLSPEASRARALWLAQNMAKGQGASSPYGAQSADPNFWMQLLKLGPGWSPTDSDVGRPTNSYPGPPPAQPLQYPTNTLNHEGGYAKPPPPLPPSRPAASGYDASRATLGFMGSPRSVGGDWLTTSGQRVAGGNLMDPNSPINQLYRQVQQQNPWLASGKAPPPEQSSQAAGNPTAGVPYVKGQDTPEYKRMEQAYWAQYRKEHGQSDPTPGTNPSWDQYVQQTSREGTQYRPKPDYSTQQQQPPIPQLSGWAALQAANSQDWRSRADQNPGDSRTASLARRDVGGDKPVGWYVGSRGTYDGPPGVPAPGIGVGGGTGSEPPGGGPNGAKMPPPPQPGISNLPGGPNVGGVNSYPAGPLMGTNPMDSLYKGPASKYNDTNQQVGVWRTHGYPGMTPLADAVGRSTPNWRSAFAGGGA